MWMIVFCLVCRLCTVYFYIMSIINLLCTCTNFRNMSNFVALFTGSYGEVGVGRTDTFAQEDRSALNRREN